MNMFEQIPFIPGQHYKRADLHLQYGGNWQSGITPSRSFPYIFIFSGSSGSNYGYQDRWENDNVFSYTGEGQIGDMKFIRGNLALRDHLELGKRVFLFEAVGKGYVEFISELEIFEFDFFPAVDKNGVSRDAIKFFFKRKGAYIPIEKEQLNVNIVNEEEPTYGTFKLPNVTERKGLVTSRVGQGAYRKSILHRWEYKCAVTNFQKLDVLIASHIVPWAKSNDKERLDVDNGILLSPTYDALFDKHLISFENNGKIILSDCIEMNAYNKIGITGRERIENLSQENHYYLERHRNIL
jgi:5-methylcytosine-specific restriction protein A